MADSSDRTHLCALLIILIAAALLRIPALNDNPNGLWVDEASTGYDAWSISKTGRDQFGELLPLFARSVGDYNESSYRFLTAPFVAVLGLTHRAVRLPAALLGILTVLLVVRLGRELFDREIGLTAGALLAVNPLHVHFSRTGFRAILVPGLLCLGLLWLVRGTRDTGQRRLVLLSTLAFCLALWSHMSARAFVPVFVFGLLLIYRKPLLASPKITGSAAALFVAVVGLLATHWLSDVGMSRASETLVDDPLLLPKYYLSYLDPDYLFWSGDPDPVYGIPGFGILHRFEAAALPVGVVWLLRKPGPIRAALLWWLLLHPFPAMLTESPTSVRILGVAPLYALLSACGLVAIVRAAKPRWARRTAVAVAAAALLASGAAFAHRLYVEYPVESAMSWDYGLREAYTAIESAPEVDCVLISNRFFLPHVYILFYAQPDPATYWANAISVEQGRWFATDYAIGRYHVRNTRGTRVTNGTCLFMARPDEVENIRASGNRVVEVRRIHDPTGMPAISLLEVSPR